MGNVEGMDQHVRAWESQAFELSRGIEVSEVSCRILASWLPIFLHLLTKHMLYVPRVNAFSGCLHAYNNIYHVNNRPCCVWMQKDYIARMATRLQKIENKLQQQKQQQQQQQEQQQQQQQHLQAPQQPVPQQMYQPQPQSHYAQQQIPQHNKQMQPQTHYGQV
jgi:hypothetical protein